MSTSNLGEFWKLPRVEAESGIRKSKIYKDERLGIFPRRIKIGRAAVWSSAQVEAWKAAQAAGKEWSAN
jgi:prophage regulatory protein